MDKERKDNNNNNEKKGNGVYCFKCNKKVSLYSIKCKCGNNFCFKHFSPLDHDCSFNYYKFNQNKLCKDNPLIKPDKITQI